MYKIELSQESMDDLEQLSDAISYIYQSPMTAKRYMKELKKKINTLRKNPEAYPVRFEQSLMQYGPFPRRVNYKKMAIIYIINGSTVYIRRIVAASMITNR